MTTPRELPPPPPGMVWLTVAVPVPEPTEGGWDAVPFKQRLVIVDQVREAISLAYGKSPPSAVAELGES